MPSSNNGKSIKPLIDWMENEHLKNPLKIGFSLESVTIPPVPAYMYPKMGGAFDDKTTNYNIDGHRLFLDKITIGEAHCQPPYNCGKYHKGRSKYFVRVKKGSINPNGPLFYHAISENYPEVANHLHVEVPSELCVVRHYAGHFKHSRKGGLPESNRILLPLGKSILEDMYKTISNDNQLKSLYVNSSPEKFLKLDNFNDMWRFAKPGEKTDDDEGRKIEIPIQEETDEFGNINKASWVTFERFGGRLNNQLVTYDWAFRISKVLKRTLFIHTPYRREHWIGFPMSKKEEKENLGLWETKALRDNFDFVFEYEVNKNGNREDHPILKGRLGEGLPKECIIRLHYLKPKYILHHILSHVYDPNLQKKCDKRLHLQTTDGLIHPWKSDTRWLNVDPFIFYRNMRPNKFLRDEAKRYITEVRSEHQNNKDDPDEDTIVVGVHTRAHNSYLEPYPSTKAYNRCNRIANKTVKAAAAYTNAVHTCCGDNFNKDYLDINGEDVFHIYYEKEKLMDMCHLNQRILDYSLHPPLLKDVHQVEKHNIQIILATDKELPDVDKLFYEKGNAVSYDSKVLKKLENKVTADTNAEKTKPSHINSNVGNKKMRSDVEVVMMDMLILQYSDFFVGAPSSTLSQAICYWRMAIGPVFKDTAYAFGDNYCSLIYLAIGPDVCEGIKCSPDYKIGDGWVSNQNLNTNIHKYKYDPNLIH